MYTEKTTYEKMLFYNIIHIDLKEGKINSYKTEQWQLPMGRE